MLAYSNRIDKIFLIGMLVAVLVFILIFLGRVDGNRALEVFSPNSILEGN
jgi:hypothetical protein